MRGNLHVLLFAGCSIRFLKIDWHVLRSFKTRELLHSCASAEIGTLLDFVPKPATKLRPRDFLTLFGLSTDTSVGLTTDTAFSQESSGRNSTRSATPLILPLNFMIPLYRIVPESDGHDWLSSLSSALFFRLFCPSNPLNYSSRPFTVAKSCCLLKLREYRCAKFAVS
jgi:hypothetical protein